MEAGVPPAAPPPQAAPVQAASDYPIRYDVEYKEQASRLTTLFRLILAIPQIIVLYLLLIVAEVLVLIAWFAIVITGKYPRGMFDFVVNVLRWAENVNAYIWLFRDEYPPFSWDPGQYPVTFEVDYPEEGLSRLTTFFRIFMLIPQIIVLYFVNLLGILVVIMYFAIVFTGKVPRGMFDLLVGLRRWNVRVLGYAFLVTDKYPPFALN
jgi:hypothetical protein